MTPVEILEDFFFIERGYLNGNHFVYPGKEPVLVDTGYVADFDETAQLITETGVNLSDVRLIINTHTLWENDMAVMTLRVEGSRALFIHLESLERLSELEIAAVYPGHGRPFVNAAAAISRAKARTDSFLKNRERLGDDLLKKIIIYTLMMHQEVEETSFFERLMATIWFRETVDLYFKGEYRMKYDDIIRDLSERGLVKHKGFHIFSTAKR